jgi:hypothetical protein
VELEGVSLATDMDRHIYVRDKTFINTFNIAVCVLYYVISSSRDIERGFWRWPLFYRSHHTLHSALSQVFVLFILLYELQGSLPFIMTSHQLEYHNK